MSVYDRVIITGGGGMLARALADRLRLRGITPDVRDRATCDITNPDQLRALVDPAPSIVINGAAYTKVDLAEQERDRAFAVNGAAAGNLARICREIGAKLVHFSTDFVFDGRRTRPYRVDDPVGPVSAYGASKLAGEVALRAAGGDDWLIIRTAWLYGPGGPSFPKTMLDVARAGKPLRVVNDQIGSPTFTYDLADATLDLIDRDARGIYHVTNSGQMSWFDFARAIFEEFGLQPDLSPITSDEWKTTKPASATRPRYSVLDLSKFEQTTGRPMRHWSDALRDFKQLVTAPNKS
jgi:dTDP-4-dehydrorhamnose reductase